MTTYTIYAASRANGYMFGFSSTYSTARSTRSTSFLSNALHVIGQNKAGSTYICYQGCSSFDCSVIDSGETVSSAIYNAYLVTDLSTQEFVWELWEIDLGAAYGNEDWVPGANMGDTTLLGQLDTTGWTASAYNQWSDDAMSAYVDAKSAATDIRHNSDRNRVGTAPTTTEQGSIYGEAQAGTANDDYLDVMAAGGGRIMSSIAAAGGLAGRGGIAGQGGGLAG